MIDYDSFALYARRYVRVLFLIAVLAVVIVALMIAAGYFFPAEHITTGEREFTTDRSTVFAAITDVGNYEAWQPDIKGIQILERNPPRWKELHGKQWLEFETVRLDRPNEWVIRITPEKEYRRFLAERDSSNTSSGTKTAENQDAPFYSETDLRDDGGNASPDENGRATPGESATSIPTTRRPSDAFRAEWQVRLSETPNGTRIQIEERAHYQKTFLRVLAVLTEGRRIQNYLNDLEGYLARRNSDTAL